MRVWHRGATLFLEVLKILTTSLFLNNFYKRQRNEFRCAFYSSLIPQKPKLQQKSDYYRKAAWNQAVKKTAPILQLHGVTQTPQDIYCDGLWWLRTRCHHTGQAHTLGSTGTREAIQCKAGFNSSKIHKAALNTCFYCTSGIKWCCCHYSRSDLFYLLPPYSLLVHLFQCKSRENHS